MALQKRSDALLAAVCVLVIAGCGGGGGGGGSGGGGSGGGGNPPPITTEPAAPIVTYSGNRDLAVLDKDNVATFATAVITMRPLMQLAESLWLPRPAGQVDDTVTGPGGGSAIVTGNVNAEQTGYLQVRYQSYNENGLTLDGRYIQRFRVESAPAGPGFIYTNAGVGTMEFDNLEITSASGVLRLHGVMRVTGGNRERFDMDLIVEDTATGETWFYENTSIDFSTIDGEFGLELGGTVYEPALGGAEFSPTTPMINLELYADTVGYPVAEGGGGFRLVSAGPLFELRALSPAFAALLIDADGDSVPEEGTRISWTALQGLADTVAPLAAGPIANAGIASYVKVDTPHTVSGLHSYDGEGDWVNYHWLLVSKPVGSAVVLDTPGMPEQTIVPDVEGDYVLTLTVSDEFAQSEATTVLSADDRLVAGTPLPPTPALEVAPPFAVAAPVRVDARVASMYPLNSMQWFSEGPGIRSITDTSDPFVSDFTADRPGVYTINTSIQSGTRSSVSFPVGGAYLATKTDWLGPDRGRDFLPVDFNDDGILDLAVRVEGRNFPTGEYGFQLMEGQGNGEFLAHPVLAAGGGEVAAGDLDGDGRLDFAVSGRAAVFVSLQAPDGSYPAFTQLALPGSDCPFGSEHDVAIADIDGDGLNDLVALKPCDETVYAWIQQPDGSLAAPLLAFDADRARQADFVDVNADGMADLVFVNRDFPTALLILALAQGDGTFAIHETFADAGGTQTTGFGTGDFNADGRTDIVRVSGTSTVWLLEQQEDGGWLERSLGVVENISTRANVAVVEIVDIDDDGDSDLLMCEQGRELWTGLQQASGSFVYNEFGDCRGDTVGRLNSMAVMDVNGDGHPDVVSNSDAASRSNTNQDLFARVYLGGLAGYPRPVP